MLASSSRWKCFTLQIEETDEGLWIFFSTERNINKKEIAEKTGKRSTLSFLGLVFVSLNFELFLWMCLDSGNCPAK